MRNLITRAIGLIARVTGLPAIAYSAPADVRDRLNTNLQAADNRAFQIHRPAARRLAEPLGYQPGLVQLHEELADIHGYLTALGAAAKDPELVADLTAAADAAGHLEEAVSRAALRTTTTAAR